MWYLTQIPKIAHFYWGGSILSYIRFLTIKTFNRFNPDWQIRFYYPKDVYRGKNQWGNGVGGNLDIEGHGLSCQDYFGEIKNIPNTKTIEIDFNQLGIGDIPDVYRSDIFRLKMLGEEGGLYSDMDIVYFLPIEKAYFNTKENAEINTVISFHTIHREYAIGFLMSSNNNPLYQHLYKLGHSIISNCGDYQQFGVKMWQANFCDPQSMINKFPSLRIHNIEMELTYAIDYTNIGGIFEGNVQYCTPKTIALHWYAGHPLGKKWENKIQENTLKIFNTTLVNTIKRALG